MANVTEEMKEAQETAATQKKSYKKKSSSPIVVIIAIIFIVIMGVVGGVSSYKNMKKAMDVVGSSGKDDGTYEVEKQDISQEIITSGTVVGVEQHAYVSPVTAKVDDILVEVGQKVERGDILLTYDTSDLGDSLEKVKIQAESERAAGNEAYEAAGKIANKASKAKKKADELDKDIKEIKKKISNLNKKVEKYEDELSINQVPTASDLQADSGEALVQGSLGEADQEKYKEYKKTVAELQKQSEKLAAKQVEYQEQKAIADTAEDAVVSNSTKAQISAANQLTDMNISDAEESLAAAQAGITADHSGIVTSVDIVKGAYAAETQTVMTVVNDDAIGVEFTIGKDDLGSVVEGQKARVVIGSNEYTGTVEFVSRVATMDMGVAGASGSSATICGRVVLDDPDDNIYIGVSAKVYIFVGEASDVLAVPYEALNSDVDGDFVYVVNSEKLIERKDVKTGLCSDEYYEITEGISEGDKVITEVTKSMKPGDTYEPPVANPLMPVQ